MLVITDDRTLQIALSSVPDPAFRSLLRERWASLGVDASSETVMTFIVVQEGDDIDAVESQCGFPIRINFVDGVRYGDPDFTPSWEWVADHGHCFEMVFVLTDDGGGSALFIVSRSGVDLELLALCREYTRK